MVPIPTSYLNVPIFGSGASSIVPEPTTYAGGFLAGQLFPAEYENWITNRLTTNSLVSQTTNMSVAAEIVNILTQASITPDPVSTTQLYAALNALYATVGALSTEASTRSASDTTLQANINAEATARMNADTSLQSQITTGLATKLTASLDYRSTGGGTRTETISAMAVGDMNFICWQLINNSGSDANISIALPSGGTYSGMIQAWAGGTSGSFGTNATTTGLFSNTRAYTGAGGSTSVAVSALSTGGAALFFGWVKRVS